MFFVISKILSFFFSPITWIFILLILTLLFKNPKTKKKLLITTLLLFYIFSNSFIVDEAARFWEMKETYDNELDSSYQAGILLGGGMASIDNKEKITFRYNPDRFFQTLRLFKTKRIKKIIISSGSGSLVYRDMLEAAILKKYLLEIGIPDSTILIDSLSDNTYQNAVFTKTILEKENITGKCLLITSATHMRRSIACFEKQNINIQAYCTSKQAGPRKWDFDHLFIPNVKSFVLWETIIHEWVGMLMYKISGYI